MNGVRTVASVILGQNWVYVEDLRWLALKPKIWHNYVLSRRYYSFYKFYIIYKQGKFVSCQLQFLEAPLVKQVDGDLKNINLSTLPKSLSNYIHQSKKDLQNIF